MAGRFPDNPEKTASGRLERLEGKLRRARDQRQKRPRRTAWGALALLPVANGVDGKPEPCGELALGETEPGAQFAHRHVAFGAARQIRHQWRLLPVANFDDPSVRLQPQAHAALPESLWITVG